TQLRVSPCIVLWFPNNHKELTPEEKYRQAVVLEATNYALLDIDGNIFSSRLQLRSGQLNGVVTIRSQMKDPGPSDDIELVTSDVFFNFNGIRTQQRVDFQFGPNSGHGYGLTIQLANTDESKKGEMPNTVKRIELRKLGELRLYVESDALNYSSDTDRAAMPLRHVASYPQATSQSNMFELRPTSPPTTSPVTPTTPGISTPLSGASSAVRPSPTPNQSEVLVRCNGVVDFDADPVALGQWLLTFRDQVNVIRTNPQGASDQLNCRELTVTFGQKEDLQKPNADDHPLAGFGSLSPLRVRALGDAGSPVNVRSPENKGFQAIGKEMVLDLVRKELSMPRSDEMSVLYDRFKIKGKALYYAPDGNDGPGKLDMPGGGTLEGTTGTDGGKPFKLTWNDGLKVLPDKDDPNLTQIQILGKPQVELADIGTVSGDEILISCDMSKSMSGGTRPASTIAGTGGNFDVDPKVIQVRKNVILKTDSGEILTNDLKIWFHQPDMAAQTTRSVSRYPGPQLRSQTSAATTTSQSNLSQLSFFGKSSDGSKSSFTVRADEVEVQAAVVGGEMAVEQILLMKNVKLDEKTSVAGEESIHISGQTARIIDPYSEQLSVTILGDNTAYAVFRGRGINLVSSNINVDRANNRFFVDGRGELRILQQAAGTATGRSESGSFSKLFTSPGNTTAANQAIIIGWAGSMDFDGKILSFIKDVNVNFSMMAINKSERVEVHLTKPFRFFEKDNTNDIEPERVVIRGNIDLERDTFAENNGGQLTHECIRLTAVEIFPITGAFKGLGPGYVSAIFQDNGDRSSSLLSSGTGNTSVRSTPATGTTASTASGLFGKGLKFMQCNFNGSVEGNYNTGQVTFYDRVVTMLCPSGSFRDVINTNNTRNIVANGMLLECNKLEITQLQLGGSKTVDLKADGNTLIEMTYDNRYYIANADKIKFEQGKNLLTLEGNQYTGVELYEGANLNALTTKRASGERIYFNPVTNEVRFEGLSMQTRIP
ncbi:MAG: LptA/OstA family protein, partial [Planctomycetaceae bacterium]|nr:LptA/OstA family protein [Planctomycetaceae bacterium]